MRSSVLDLIHDVSVQCSDSEHLSLETTHTFSESVCLDLGTFRKDATDPVTHIGSCTLKKCLGCF